VVAIASTAVIVAAPVQPVMAAAGVAAVAVAAAITRGIAAGVAAIVAWIAAGDLLRHAAADHPAAGVRLALRDAADHGPAGLVRHELPAGYAVADLPVVRNTLVAAHLALNLFDDLLVGANLAGVRFALAHGAVASDRAFFIGRARNPAANGLHRDAAARIAAAIAAVVAARVAAIVVAAEQATPAPTAGVVARNALAFPVAVVNAAAHTLGVGLAPIAGLVVGALLIARNAAAHLLADGLVLRDHLVFADVASARFGIALTAIRGVVLLFTLAAVHGSCTLVRFGDPFATIHGTVLGRTCGRRGTRCRLWSVLISPCGQGRRGQDAASQQGNAKMLPNHAFSFFSILADPGRHRDDSAGQDRTTHEVERHPTMPNVGGMEKKKWLGI
jgi:hypothetical protein